MGRFFNNRSSGDRYSGGRSDRPTMHDAVCDSCGKDCQVPFRPSGDKPIYCSNCFEREGGRRDSSSGRRDVYRSDRNDRGDSRGGNKEMFSAVCDECGKDCEVPFRPSPDKPIYCSRCFDNVSPKREDNRGGRDSKRGSSNTDISQLKDQMSSINTKLDKLLDLLAPSKEEDAKPSTKKSAKKEVEPKKKVVKKKTATKVLKKDIPKEL